MPIGIARIGNPGQASIRNNTIYNCTNADVAANNSQPEIYNNVFYACANGIRLQNNTATSLTATGQYWNAQFVIGPVNVSSPQSSHHANAGALR